MRCSLLLLVPALLSAQAPGPDSDPAYEPLSKAYEALKQKDYDTAIPLFLKAIEAVPARSAIRKDLAYTYLKVGETEAARDQFHEAMRLNPRDFHVALEYAFLCFETKERARARRVFDRVRQSGDPASRATAEQAFQNIDRPLAEGIARWSKVAAESPANFMAHFELAQLAEQRDELDLAADHYLKAWRILPARRSILLDYGRVTLALNRIEESIGALVAASRGPEPRAAELARELLPPDRYPYVVEFRRAIELDPASVPLRRDLAFLLLRMDRQPDAEREFRTILDMAPSDPLSCAQLGFLYLARDERARAIPLLERVLESGDEALANKVRIVLRMPQRAAAAASTLSGDVKVLAERSYHAGFLADALRYLQTAHEQDREDPWVMLKLGWTYNLLHNDRQAIAWFDRARRSPDALISAEATQAYKNLRPTLARLRTTAWLFPFYSSRWRDVFSYGQIKTDVRLGNLPFRPYISARFLGDTRRTTGGPFPQYLSENSMVLAGGIASRYWHGLMGWGEAGWAVSYLRRRAAAGRMIPDYRGGVAYAKGFGHMMGGDAPGLFFEFNADGVFISRFEDDILVYQQNRFGYTMPANARLGELQMQLYWAGNFTTDTRRLAWANFVETGPGVRFRWPWMPRSLAFSVNFLRGAYTVPQDRLREPNFFDLRAGFWYAVTH